MNEHITIFLTTLMVLYSTWVMMNDEQGFVLSTKRSAGALLVMALIVQIIVLVSQSGEKETLLRTIVENNITLPALFENQVIDTKLMIASDKLKVKLEQENANNHK